MEISNTNQYRIQTLINKFWISYYVLSFALKLIWRGVIHDFSKPARIEAEAYGERPSKFKKAVYGSSLPGIHDLFFLLNDHTIINRLN